MYEATGTIMGQIKVESNCPGWSVAADKIEVALEEYVCLSDPYVTNDVCSLSVPVTIEPTNIVGEMLFNFEMDISQTRCKIPLKVKDPMALSDDYIGVQFGIKHAIVVTIDRPWYTFPVVSYTPVAIYSSEPAPTESLGGKLLTEGELEESIQTEIRAAYLTMDADDEADEDRIRAEFIADYEREVAKSSSVLDVEGYPCDECTFDFGCDCANIEDGIDGVLNIKGAKVPVESVELSLIKTETIDYHTQTCVIKSMSLMGKEGGEEVSELADFEDFKMRFGLGEVETQTCAPGEDGQAGLLSPTMGSRPSGTSNNFRKNWMEVKYSLKLSVSGKDRSKYWDTREIFLYRGMLPRCCAEEGAGRGAVKEPSSLGSDNV